MQRINLLALLLMLGTSVWAQKKTLDHKVYNDWKSIRSSQISDDGRWVGYIIKPQVGDGTLYVYDTQSKKTDSLSRVKSFSFGPESNYLLAKVSPGYDTLRSLKLKKTKPNKMPKDSAFLWVFEKDTIVKFSKCTNTYIPEEGFFLTLKKSTSSAKFEEEKKRCKLFRKKIPKIERSTEGKDLIVIDTRTLNQTIITGVKAFANAENGKFLSTIIHEKIDTLDTYNLHKYTLEDMSKKVLYTSGKDVQDIRRLSLSYNGSHVAFLESSDTADNKVYSLMVSISNDSAKRVIDSSSVNMPKGWSTSSKGSVWFSENEEELYFGIAPFPFNAPKDTLLKSEKHALDVWHWKDPQLQPRQLLFAERDRNKTYSSVFNIKQKQWQRIQSDKIDDIILSDDQTHDLVIGITDNPYEVEQSWSMPWLSDYYITNKATGEEQLLIKGLGYGLSLSPEGKYAVYYNHLDSSWNSINMASKTVIKLTIPTTDELYDDINGSPYSPGSRGHAGWSKEDKRFLVNTKHHVWSVDPKNESTAICLSDEKEEHIRYRLMHLDVDKEYHNLDSTLLFHVYNEYTKSQGIIARSAEGKFTVLDTGAYSISGFGKAKDSQQYYVRRGSFTQYAEMEISKDLKTFDKISETNPQQKDYNWGTVDLIRWQSYKGVDLQGLLYKPENYDPNKKYPLMVYFYERYDNRIHAYYAPQPTASIVFPTEYVSNGYIVFIPNIEYKPGSPGDDAYDCILSGVDDVINRMPNIDTTKMALQGQSWGGYQTAYLVTRTNRFAAAMAGAPVSNMISAYGGIRWGTGMSRMFQYEHTQSRLGGTLWDSLSTFMHNSPIFHTPKVQTPLLMMHNDNDGAVPWYQSIEYFVALRRLGKPAWLLNYNGEQHNLMRRANRVDLSIRMRQFFDHYLLDKPAPEWLENGLPAVNKGRSNGYELTE